MTRVPNACCALRDRRLGKGSAGQMSLPKLFGLDRPQAFRRRSFHGVTAPRASSPRASCRAKNRGPTGTARDRGPHPVPARWFYPEQFCAPPVTLRRPAAGQRGSGGRGRQRACQCRTGAAIRRPGRWRDGCAGARCAAREVFSTGSSHAAADGVILAGHSDLARLLVSAHRAAKGILTTDTRPEVVVLARLYMAHCQSLRHVRRTMHPAGVPTTRADFRATLCGKLNGRATHLHSSMSMARLDQHTRCFSPAAARARRPTSTASGRGSRNCRQLTLSGACARDLTLCPSPRHRCRRDAESKMPLRPFVNNLVKCRWYGATLLGSSVGARPRPVSRSIRQELRHLWRIRFAQAPNFAHARSADDYAGAEFPSRSPRRMSGEGPRIGVVSAPATSRKRDVMTAIPTPAPSPEPLPRHTANLVGPLPTSTFAASLGVVKLCGAGDRSRSDAHWRGRIAAPLVGVAAYWCWRGPRSMHLRRFRKEPEFRDGRASTVPRLWNRPHGAGARSPRSSHHRRRGRRGRALGVSVEDAVCFGDPARRFARLRRRRYRIGRAPVAAADGG